MASEIYEPDFLEPPDNIIRNLTPSGRDSGPKCREVY